MALSAQMQASIRVRPATTLTLIFVCAIVGPVFARGGAVGPAVAPAPHAYQSTTDADLARSEAEARKAAAEADRAELLARSLRPPRVPSPAPSTRAS